MIKIRLVILAGGGGTRLYPLSTEDEPKQFVKILHGKSLFQKTIERFSSYFDRIQVITLKKYEDIARRQANEIGAHVEIITEPARKNTLAPITLAAMIDNEKMLVTPADHVMDLTDPEPIIKGLESANNRIILYGIKPRHPATEYGYIQPGEKINDHVYAVKKFHEKPDEQTARKYIKNGYLWNSGIFAINPDHFIEEVKTKAPIYVEKIEKYIADNDPYQYIALPELQIDKGLLERTKNLGVIPLDVKWSDLGSYKSIHEYFEKDENNNVIIGPARVKDVKNSIIITDTEFNVCCMNSIAAVSWKRKTYIGPINDMKAPKNFVYIP